MIVIIQETIWANNQWLVVASVDAGTGTMVGPYILDLPEDATEAQMIAAIEAIVNPPPPAPVAPIVEPSGEDDGQDPSVDP